MKTRVKSAIVMLAIVGVCVFVSPLTRLLFLVAVAFLAGREMLAALTERKADTLAVGIVWLYILGLAAMSYFKADALCRIAWFFLAFVLAMSAGVFSKKLRGRGAVAILSTLVYPMLPLAILVDLALLPHWAPIFALGCFSTWLCDSFALFGGKRFGKHKAAPEVSPNKTVEGCVCGAVFSLVGGAIVYLLFRDAYALPLWLCLVTALVASTLGQIGDLAASLIKRMVGLKDYSNLIPGHGGAMDRCDSLLFSIPTAYFCLYLAGVI